MVVIDYAIGLSEPAIVSDHLNLTGSSPLSDRIIQSVSAFPWSMASMSVKTISCPSVCSRSKVVVAGLKDGVKTGDKELV